MKDFINIHITYYDKDKNANVYSYMLNINKIIFVQWLEDGRAYIAMNGDRTKTRGLFVDESYDEIQELLSASNA